MANRLQAVQEAMADAPFDVLVLVPGPSFFYVTGAPLLESSRLNLLFIPKQGTPRALAPALEAPYLHALDIPIREWMDGVGPDEALATLVRESGMKGESLGLLFSKTTLRAGDAIRRALPDATLVPADSFLAGLRSRKDAEELAAIRRAIAVTERGFEQALTEVQVGQTEAEVAALIQISLLRAGSDSMAFAPHVVSGPRSAEPHAGSGDRPLQAGDVVIVDWGATVNHYSGDITRCLAVGEVPEEIERIYALCCAANEAGRAAVRPGATGHEVDAAARDTITQGGYGERFIHRTGHGLGLDIHEPPDMVSGNHAPLQPGNVFTVEPGIYLPGLGGVRMEDNMLVTEAGGETLTTLPRDLIRIQA